MNKAKYISGILFDNSLSENSYLNNLPIIKYLTENKELEFSSNITFFVGENGTGKSTLLEAIAVAYGFNAEGGTKNFSFSTKDTHSELSEHLTLIKRDYAKDGFFLRTEVCIMLPHILMRSKQHITMATLPCTTNLTGKVFYL